MGGENFLDRVKMICGGQTGIDRAMLDYCLDHQRACGGWCPHGRRAEDGRIAPKYPLQELPDSSYDKRTTRNVMDADALVIIYHERMTGGTLLSFEFAGKQNKKLLPLDMSVWDAGQAALRLREFILEHKLRVLNISGPRASEWKDAYAACYRVLEQTFGS